MTSISQHDKQFTPTHVAVRRGERMWILNNDTRTHNVRVFGSVARGESDSQSDVDFLVDLDPGRTISDLGGLLMDLQDALGAPVDVVTERGLRVRVRERILAEAVVL